MKMYKIIALTKSGSHMIFRGTVDLVANFNNQLKKARDGWSCKFTDGAHTINMKNVLSARAIREDSHELFLAM